MKRARSSVALFCSLVFLTLIVSLCPDIRAVPSFSRQTGLACNVCHSNPPELTSFGRTFKLNGYTLTDTTPGGTIEAKDLKISKYFPLSVMLLLSDTSVDTHVPGTQNTSAEFPQTFSLFLAGEFAPHFGGQVQATYSHQSDHFTLDNTDLRYANHTKLHSKDLLYGITLNNAPTVEDVWNSTPIWGYPWLSPNSPPSPGARPIILGALAQDVAGVGAYTMWNDHLYAGVTVYRSEHIAGPQFPTGTNPNFAFNIHGVAPYWRLAWQQTWGLNYFEVGTYGIHVSSVPGAVSGIRDSYTDPSVDLQYERPLGVNLLTAHLSYTHEISDLQATFAAAGADKASHHLNTLRADANFHIHSRYLFTLAGFSTTGNSDAILFAPAPVTGSATNSPNSSGYITQFGYWPMQNIEISGAYTGYTKFNGATHNYDGSGRDASANNSIYIALWLNF
jgi:hypothetical protein